MRFNFDCAVLTAKQIHLADQRAEAQGIAPYDLMQQAGAALSAIMIQRYPNSRALILCGPGNNGGDGFVLARLLQQKGWTLDVVTPQGRLPNRAPAAEHADLWEGPIYSFADLSLKNIQVDYDLLIDAGFGVGLDRALDTQWQQAIDVFNAAALPLVAVDIPSGVADDGRLFCERPIQADLTLALYKKKLAHLVAPARFFSGEVQVCDIGLGSEVLADQLLCYENRPALWQEFWARTRPGQQTHKYHRGHVLVLGGEVLPGAAVLSAFGAAYTGAGLVSLLCPPASWSVYAAQMRSIMVRSFNSSTDFSTWVHGRKTDAIVLGPGAIEMAELADLIDIVLTSKKPCVLDAEAINILATYPERFLPKLHHQCVLTPHVGEFQRLIRGVYDGALFCGMAQLRQMAIETGATVLLKGAESLIACPTGAVIINTEASPYLATAGSGDVLAGVIATFLAQQVPPALASAMAVWLHGHAANIAGVGLIADDLPHYLVKAQQSLMTQLAS